MRGRLRKARQLPKLMEMANVFSPQMNESLTYCVPTTRIAINKQIFEDIKHMKHTAAHYRVAYLHANQVESFYRVFLINKLVHNMEKINLGANKEFHQASDFEAFINPEIIQAKNKEEVEQSCLTFPFIKFKVDRFNQVTLKYKDEDNSSRVQTFTGIYGRLVQHCIDHLNGQLLIDYKLSKGKFYIQPDSAPYFPKTSFLLKQYSYRLKDHASKDTVTPEQQNKYEEMKRDYIERLKNQYIKESQKFSEKLQKKQIPF